MPYPVFDRSRLKLKPLSERVSDLSLNDICKLNDPIPKFDHSALKILATKIASAYKNNATIMLLMGAHVIRSGVSPYLIDLMRRGIITLIGCNGACAIHDMELAMIGKTTESVARYIKEGQFGLWSETGKINQAAIVAKNQNYGLGEAIGKMISDDPATFPYKDISLFAQGYNLKVPITVHVSIGQDIIHEHPNFDGASFGESSYKDFLTLTHYVENLENGVMLNFGTAVMGPEVFLKALSMARNVAHQNDQQIKHFTTAVFDLLDLGEDPAREAPKSDARYYFRPYKTILVRTVADGGGSFYIKGRHSETIPVLYWLILKELEK